jgi:hypothetical protein
MQILNKALIDAKSEGAQENLLHVNINATNFNAIPLLLAMHIIKVFIDTGSFSI